MLQAALIVNIIVLVPVCIGLIKRSRWTLEAYGIDTPSRRILLAVYISILLMSLMLLRWFHTETVIALLGFQILYKVLSPITLRQWRNPLVISNLLIALFHLTALIQEGPDVSF